MRPRLLETQRARIIRALLLGTLGDWGIDDRQTDCGAIASATLGCFGAGMSIGSKGHHQRGAIVSPLWCAFCSTPDACI